MLLIGQLLVIFFGIMILGILLRILDTRFLAETGRHLEKDSLHYLRDYGFWLSLLPLGWAVAAIRNARDSQEGKTKLRRYELGGWVIFFALLLFFLIVCCGFLGWFIFIAVMAAFYYFLWRVL